jgi:hypothetical protein
MKIAKLIDNSNGLVVAFLDIWKTDCSLDGNLFSVDGWAKNPEEIDPQSISFVSQIYLKWDMCTHWWFNGQNHVDGKEIYPYYHLCGGLGIMDFIRGILFACKVAIHYVENIEDYEIIDFSPLNGFEIKYEDISEESALSYCLDSYRDEKRKIHNNP